MNKQPEALRLADHLDADHEHLQVSHSEISAELRRLYAENKALNDALKYSMGCHREMSELAVRQRARLDELEPQVEQEPVAWYDGRKFYGNKAAASMNMANMSVLSPVYLHQQPKRAPLTNEQVKAGLIHLIEYTDARERCAFNIGVRFAEHAHGIK